MRWVGSLFALGLMMVFLHRFTAGGPLEARATLALGFLLLAALLGGNLAQRLRLPRLTGYLFVGFSVGPAWFGLVRADEVAALRFFADGAVALIAFAAGSETRLATLRTERVALTRLAVGTLLFPLVAVGLVTLSVTPWFPITVHQSFGDGIAVALVLGTIAAASSPAFTMALMGELDARGAFARSILAVTVAKDVAVFVLFALVLAVGRPLASAGALNLSVAESVLATLVGSIAVGLGLGALLAQLLRRVERDTALLLVAVAFATAAAGRLGRLEPVLVALTAGFCLENFSPVEGRRVRKALARGSLPVSVVFFALAGAGLHLGTLADLWPWVALLVGLRAVALRYGVRWAGRDLRVTQDIARDGWLGLISQAGVTLGLAAAARRAFPEWGVSLEALVVAMVAVHEVAGPICFRRALVRAGEVTEGIHGAERPVARGAVVSSGSGMCRA